MKVKIALILLFISGCSIFGPGNPMSLYISPCFEDYKIKKVLVLPFFQNGEIEKHQITGIFTQALQRARQFEVLTVQKHHLEQLYPSIVACQDTVIASELLKIAKTYDVQGVIRGRITSYETLPNTLGLKIDLISTSDGSIVWSVDTIYHDHDFFSSKYNSPSNAMYTISPTKFVRTVCYNIASTISK